VASASWQGEDYAPHAAHHRALDEWFLARHRPAPDDVVVDAGCGTGEFTMRLAALVPDGHVIGVEPDPSMLAVARERVTSSNVEFREGAIQQLDDVVEPGTVDLVVSRAVFHWIRLAEYPRCYDAVLRILVPGGWFHAESGGAGNVARVVDVLDAIAAQHGAPGADVNFPHAGVALELLEAAGFAVPDGGVRTVAQRRPFDLDGLRGFLRTQAALAYVGRVDPARRDAFLTDVESDAAAAALRRHDGSYDQTFVRLDVLAQRPN
jgi:trans-aconitate methyltransferase